MRSHNTGPKMCETVTLTGTIWKWFLNGARWKRNSSRCRVNTKYVTFWLHFSAQPPVSQNSNQLNCFLCYFLCPFWKVWGLSGLMLTCQQILTTSCEYTRDADIFSCQNRVNILVLNAIKAIKGPSLGRSSSSVVGDVRRVQSSALGKISKWRKRSFKRSISRASNVSIYLYYLSIYSIF